MAMEGNSVWIDVVRKKYRKEFSLMRGNTSPFPQVVLGTDLARNRQFILTGSPLAQSKLISGISGSGKSRLIAGMCVQLLREGIPFSLIDPHEDLGKGILETLIATGFYKDDRAYSKVWYVDFSRQDAFVAFNCLKQPYPPHQVAENLLEAWKRAWSGLEENAVNLENILLSGVYVLVVNQRPLTELAKLLSDMDFRAGLLAHVDDPLIVDFFHTRFDGWGRGRSSALSESTLRRAFLLTYSPTLRYSLGQVETRLNFRAIMDQGVSVIFNISNLDAQTQRFLGALIATGFEMAALSRADIPEWKRTPYHLFLDEFTMYSAQSSASLERILTLTRKFGLTLNLACQTLSQTKEIKDALQNCLHITFKLGFDDAQTVAPRFMDYSATKERTPLQKLFSQEQLLVEDSQKRTEWTQLVKGLDRRECLINLGGKTFKLQTLGVPDQKLGFGELEMVKARYAKALLTPKSHIHVSEAPHQVEALVPEPEAPVPVDINAFRKQPRSKQAGRTAPPVLTPQPSPGSTPQTPSPGKKSRRWEDIPDNETC
jgi:hypothetical protein